MICLLAIVFIQNESTAHKTSSDGWIEAGSGMRRWQAVWFSAWFGYCGSPRGYTYSVVLPTSTNERRRSPNYPGWFPASGPRLFLRYPSRVKSISHPLPCTNACTHSPKMRNLVHTHTHTYIHTKHHESRLALKALLRRTEEPRVFPRNL